MSCPHSKVHLWPKETCLVRQLADALAAMTQDERAAASVILPTRRLSAWLMALLEQRLGSIVPPWIGNLPEFIERHAPIAADDEDVLTLTSSQEQILVAELLATRPYKTVLPEHEHELRQLFAEMVDAQLGADAFERLREDSGPSLVESHAAALAMRLDELEDAYVAFHEMLAKAKVTTERMRSVKRSRALAEMWQEQTAQEAWDETAAAPLFVVGFTSSAPSLLPLWKAMASLPRAQLWFPTPPTLSGRRHPLRELIDELSQEPCLEKPGSAEDPAPEHSQTASAHVVEHRLGEVELALDLVEAALAAGHAPAHIAVLVTDDAAYGIPLKQAFDARDIPSNLAVASPMASTRLGRWLAGLHAILRTPHAAIAWLAFATEGPTVAWVHARLDEQTRVAHDLAACRAWLGRALAALDEVTDETCQGIRDPLARQALLDLRAELAPLLALAKGGKSSLEAWSRAMVAATEPFLRAHDEREAQVERERQEVITEQLARDHWTTYLAELAAYPSAAAAILPMRILLASFEAQALHADARGVGEPLAGVQALSFAEARFVPFTVTIVLGCVEGRLPRSLPRDRLLDDVWKVRLGLMGWAALEAIEDTSFYLLSARLPDLKLLRSAMDLGSETVPSRFLTRLEAEGRLVHVDAGKASDAGLPRLWRDLSGHFWQQHHPVDEPPLHASPHLRQRAAGHRLAPEGVHRERAASLGRLSASGLTSLIACPYRFLLERMGVRALTLPGERVLQSEGELLHAILEVFFTGMSQGKRLLEPWPSDWDGSDEEGCRARLLERLMVATEKVAPSSWVSSPVLLHLRYRAWPAFITHIERIYGYGKWHIAKTAWREQAIGHAHGGPTLEFAGERFTLSGRIDSIDPWHAAQGLVVTDYKRRSPPDARQVRLGLEPQLVHYAWALAAVAEMPDGDAAPTRGPAAPLAQLVIGHFGILSGTWSGVAAGSQVLAEAGKAGLVSGKSLPALESAAAATEELLVWRLETIQSEERYGADPSRCGLCSLGGICRKDDPALMRSRRQQRRLRAKLAGELPQTEAAAESAASHDGTW